MKKPSDYNIDPENDSLPIVIIAVAVIVLIIGLYHVLNIKVDTQEPELEAKPIPEETVLIEESVSIEQKAAPEISDREMIARVVMAESRGEKFIGKVAVAAVVLNRSRTWNKSVKEICEAEGQFDYPFYGKVSNSCYEAVDYAMQHRDIFPKNMLYFRNKQYHDFADPYIQIGNHYFSTDGDPEWEIETLGKED